MSPEPRPVRIEWLHSEFGVLAGGRLATRCTDPTGEDVLDLLHALRDAADELRLDEREWVELLRAATRAHERRLAS